MPNKTDHKIIDAIGKRIVESTAISNSEIEDIVSNPRLFEGVMKRTFLLPGPPKGSRSSSWTFQTATFAALLLVVVAAMVIGIRSWESTSKDAGPAVGSPIQSPDAGPVTARSAILPQMAIREETTDRADNSKANVRRIAYRPTGGRQTHKIRSRSVEPARFYSFGVDGESDLTLTGGHIVRVTVHRSSLFALGVNVPLENGPEVVKADIVVAPDGTAKAIRLLD